MNMSASHCSSSGCDSGWTMYLDQSSFSKNQRRGFGGYSRTDVNEEEDLSMVSDASSGPPQYCEDDEYSFDHHHLDKKSKHKKKSKDSGRNQQQYPFLDDTASSPVLKKKVSKNEEHALEFSQGSSATHFKAKSALKKHFGFFQSEKSGSKEPGGFQGRKWK